jgi:hypothetical protein
MLFWIVTLNLFQGRNNKDTLIWDAETSSA